MSRDSERITFHELKNQLAALDRDEAEATIAAAVEQRWITDADRHLDWDPLHPGAAATSGHIANDLWHILGDWYHSGPIVGDETTTDFCWCHGLNNAIKDVAAEDTVPAITAALMEQVDLAITWRLGVIEAIDEAIGSELTDEGALVQVVERVIDLGVWEMWYVHVTPVATWLVEASGRSATPGLSSAIRDLTNTQFTSWSTPADTSIATFAVATAWAIVEAKLDHH